MTTLFVRAFRRYGMALSKLAYLCKPAYLSWTQGIHYFRCRTISEWSDQTRIGSDSNQLILHLVSELYKINTRIGSDSIWLILHLVSEPSETNLTWMELDIILVGPTPNRMIWIRFNLVSEPSEPSEINFKQSKSESDSIQCLNVPSIIA